MTATEHTYTSHDGLELFYREYGGGDDTVICLPGLTRNSKDFQGLAEHLSGRWRVLTPDLRGRGRSAHDPKWKQYLPPTYVRDTWTLMDTLGIESAAIIGTSLGGLMAMIMADQQPQRMRGVVMNDVGPEVAPAALERILEYAGRTPAQPDWAAAATLARQNYEIAYPDQDDAFWDEQARLAWRETADGQVAPDYDRKIGDALRHMAKSMGLIRFLQKLGVRRLKGLNLSPWDNFRKMTMPVLLLKGGISDLVAEETVEGMKAIKPDLDVVEVPNRGHAPTLDEPVSRAAIDAFLARL
ncbi:alpha/beta hydrolase [Marinihelvus fidelis]|uniref:Alpha/beta hydrolase n=1 Tax=Marinihelvus fidelis TaxID=2613842 RepID=A0A5N0TCR4_9GAMM|nr:alpha/beta hydrolase [Marinihelvus fidelis]KAA9132760.1 alpha/beta hydrolase [Marinihelvus fidelis]